MSDQRWAKQAASALFGVARARRSELPSSRRSVREAAPRATRPRGAAAAQCVGSSVGFYGPQTTFRSDRTRPRIIPRRFRRTAAIKGSSRRRRGCSAGPSVGSMTADETFQSRRGSSLGPRPSKIRHTDAAAAVPDRP